ncbi:MAG: hypothetical protein K6E33_06730, partial [Lachnospiraceae bacterium]|nr:hypothetical protein [Lachnospiraceae bacterium]
MTETERRAFYIRLINGVLIFLFVLTGLIVATYIKDDWISPRTLYVEELDEGWTRVNEDGSRKIVSGNFSIGNSGPVTFYRILPDIIEDDQILRFTCTFRTVDATVNGKNIYHAGPAKFGPISTSVGNLFALIPMSSDYSGQKIYITVEPRHYFYDVTVQDAAITTMASYSLERIAESVPYLCLCVIILAISIISFFMYIGFKFAPTDSERTISKGFFHLFVFGISAICWIISDFHVAGMLTGRMALSGVINYISFMICPIMFSGVLIYIFDNRLFFRILF